MLFTEFGFFVFFAIIWLLYWSLPAHQSRKILLVVGSYIFYGFWDYRFLGLVFLLTLGNYAAAKKIAVAEGWRRRKIWIIASVSINLGILAVFKYYNFFAETLGVLLTSIGIDSPPIALKIILPVGLSFYTFHNLSYIIDVYSGKMKPRESLLDMALYVAFFPQLVAGPITRARSFLSQFDEAKQFHTVAVKSLLALFLTGFIKKACISDNLAHVVEMAFETPTDFAASALFFAVLLYSFQIYCDFSGYSDMAIAVAGLLGYTLPVNFNTPYFAVNPTDFWRRWHISLSTWLRDYLYIPLGGGKNGRWLLYRNIMITMVLGGMWHGAAWPFVVWGFLHGLALIIHKYWLDLQKKIPGWFSLPVFAATLMTYYWVCFAWIFFRAADMERATIIAKAFVLWQAEGQKTLDVNAPVLFATIFFAHWIKNRLASKISWEKIPDWAFALGLGVTTAVAVAFISVGYNPFIYFQF